MRLGAGMYLPMSSPKVIVQLSIVQRLILGILGRPHLIQVDEAGVTYSTGEIHHISFEAIHRVGIRSSRILTKVVLELGGGGKVVIEWLSYKSAFAAASHVSRCIQKIV